MHTLYGVLDTGSVKSSQSAFGTHDPVHGNPDPKHERYVRLSSNAGHWQQKPGPQVGPGVCVGVGVRVAQNPACVSVHSLNGMGVSPPEQTPDDVK